MSPQITSNGDNKWKRRARASSGRIVSFDSRVGTKRQKGYKEDIDASTTGLKRGKKLCLIDEAIGQPFDNLSTEAGCQPRRAP